jgi:hypothetical protein
VASEVGYDIKSVWLAISYVVRASRSRSTREQVAIYTRARCSHYRLLRWFNRIQYDSIFDGWRTRGCGLSVRQGGFDLTLKLCSKNSWQNPPLQLLSPFIIQEVYRTDVDLPPRSRLASAATSFPASSLHEFTNIGIGFPPSIAPFAEAVLSIATYLDRPLSRVYETCNPFSWLIFRAY